MVLVRVVRGVSVTSADDATRASRGVTSGLAVRRVSSGCAFTRLRVTRPIARHDDAPDERGSAGATSYRDRISW